MNWRYLLGRVVGYGALVGGGLLMASCASFPSGADWNESLVSRNAQKRWDALLAGRLDEAYDYLSPGSRVLISQDQYRVSMPRKFWTDAKVSSVHCEKDRCDVQVKVGYRYVPGRKEVRGEHELKEKWVKEAGEWHYVYAR